VWHLRQFIARHHGHDESEARTASIAADGSTALLLTAITSTFDGRGLLARLRFEADGEEVLSDIYGRGKVVDPGAAAGGATGALIDEAIAVLTGTEPPERPCDAYCPVCGWSIAGARPGAR
jgi:hypothetical protein